MVGTVRGYKKDRHDGIINIEKDLKRPKIITLGCKKYRLLIYKKKK